MHPVVWIAAVAGGLAFWRRKRLKDDAAKVKTSALEAKAKAEARIAEVRGAEPKDTGEAGEAGDAAPADITGGHGAEGAAEDGAEGGAAAGDDDGDGEVIDPQTT
jgi:hypothetical protein